ncbi:response regulator transcription factor [Bosea sp. (in: a-proteobacteria)]|uniref:response regulator transcription factor n=1 Tax=Bosea sp. (in: a-proteobacteria) TaxID=1871050 RepID=UPI002FCB8A73
MSLRLVHLIDDDWEVREALSFLLRTVGLEVRAYQDALAFLEALPGLPAGCIVTDIRMPRLTGLRLQERLAASRCRWPVIVITGHGDVEACRAAFRNGAADFLTKPIDEQVLIDTVQAALARLEQMLAAEEDASSSRRRLERLSEREREILALIAEGRSTKEIARTLGISPRTVDTHRAHLAEKLESGSVADMVRLHLLGADR